MSLALTVILMLVGFLLLWLVYALIWGTPPDINLAAERLSLRMMFSDPETLTTLSLLDNTPLDFHSGRLTDSSPRHMAFLRKLDRDGLRLIHRYDPQKLSGEKCLTYQVMDRYFEQNLRGHRFNYHWGPDPVFMGPYPVNHVFGVQVNLIHFLSTTHQIKGTRSVRRYLKRLSQVEWKLSGLRESLAAREAAGVLPPRFALGKSITQVEDFLATSIEENPLYLTFMERLVDSGRFNARAQTHWQERVRQAVQNEVIPPYQELLTFLQDQLPRTTTDDGVWKLPDGEDYYTFLLRTHTTTDLTAEEVHQLGLREVDHLTNSVREVLRALNLTDDDPGEQLQLLMKAQQFHYADDEDQRDKVIADYQAILDEVNQRLLEVFSFGSMDRIIVQRLPEYKEPDSPIAYAQAPAMDGSRPGIMWVNLREPDNVYTWGMRTLAYHEGLPGHIYQMAQTQRIKGLPSFRRAHSFNAYIEGWALYGERLGWELGLEDEMSNLGRLQALLWRAARLVVDTGIHIKRWTREEAIDYMVEKTGLLKQDVTAEVERYIVMPGQACAYYLGYLKMLSLRRKAQSTLGDNFNLKDFHDTVLQHGSLPLTLLEGVVNDYIDRTAGLSGVVDYLS
jgi:uncharacterized protein (DUF885 family)